VNPGARERYTVPASYNTPAMLLVKSKYVGHHYAQTNTNNTSDIFNIDMCFHITK
jgi:hypothetical protein